MGMFDTIRNVPVKCPRCGNEGSKSVQIKSGPQNLSSYEFGKDKIKINWTYEYYGSIIDEDKKMIRGIAICEKCEEKSALGSNIGLFDVAITLNENNIPIVVDIITKLSEIGKKIKY